ncbi:tetratricopeptide repeat protein [Nibricoccus sp. IMCC34717]|uniref:tetratricopeptide repeat protein n=1 Tax=Nibricoccus sp. IMCC34717 TaxID=3034021 RepID=UPI00384E29D6
MDASALPPQVVALVKQGLALLQQGKWEEAAGAYGRALALKPDFAELHNDLGNLLLNLGRAVEAEQAARRAVYLKSGYAPGWCNLGNALTALERRAEAAEAYGRALALEPGLAAARYNLGLVQLAQEQFREGWENYEARWDSEMKTQRRELPGRRWRGETPEAGEALFVYAEQGLGDTLQFCRYLEIAAARGFARVVCEVPEVLRAVVGGMEALCGGRLAVVAKGSAEAQAASGAAWHCPMLSLPLALGVGVAVPLSGPRPYLKPTEAARERWARRLSGGGPKLGLVWSCNLRHRRGLVRVIGATAMRQAVRNWAGEIYGLVKEVRPEDRAAAAGWTDLGPELKDFDDTAAALERMDAVVTVDTSVAHLAGALGRRTLLVLPFGADWRWMERREETLWYPTMRLFRQPKPGDWGAVAEEVAGEV